MSSPYVSSAAIRNIEIHWSTGHRPRIAPPGGGTPSDQGDGGPVAHVAQGTQDILLEFLKYF